MAPEVIDRVIEQTGDDVEDRRTLVGGPPPFDPEPPDGPDDGDPFGDDEGPPDSPMSNARLGMIMLLGAETMFFAGLIGSFLVFRVANTTWPPPMFPKLPIVVTGVNTLFLLYSAVTMWMAQQAMRAGMMQRCVRFLLYTAVLGVVFLAVQGYEWLQLIEYGLTLSSGVYGATFYILIGCHGLHVLGAVVWLISVLAGAMRGRYCARRSIRVSVCGMYWYYVVGLWPALYWLVYLY
jgi:heme/copper-type cytochrome/quinol oxidase subunit 3